MSVSTLIFINTIVIITGFVITVFGLIFLWANYNDYQRYCLITLGGVIILFAGFLVWAIGHTKIDTYTPDKYDLQAMYSDIPMTVEEGDEEYIKIYYYFGREEAVYYRVPTPTPSPYDNYLLENNG